MLFKNVIVSTFHSDEHLAKHRKQDTVNETFIAYSKYVLFTQFQTIRVINKPNIKEGFVMVILAKSERNIRYP